MVCLTGAMKRLNPDTKKPYNGGDTRADGYIFKAYKNYLKKDGFFSEKWIEPKTNKKINEIQKQRMKIRRLRSYKGPHLKRRLDPLTNSEFKLGARDEKNRYFLCYRGYSYDNKLFHEEWARELGWHGHHISAAVSSAKKRAKKNNLPFSITRDYAESLFPKDMKCPALGIKMFWGIEKSKFSSPSLDRIIPKKGYVEGNICWLSVRANIIKSDASAIEIQKVASYLDKIEERTLSDAPEQH